MGSEKSILRIVTTGSVDDGKSTLIGRLLYETKSIFEDQYEAIKKTSLKRGSNEVDLSLLLDGLTAEREQAITIDVAYRYFSTEARKFIIADCPGHEQYTRNMFTGASTADIAILLIDAGKGVLTQTRRHSFIVDLLGLKHLIIAVNKIDSVNYSEEIINRITAEYRSFSSQLKIENVTIIPVSALVGDNVVTRSENTPWYKGPTLLKCLEQTTLKSPHSGAFRFPVQYVIRPDSAFRGYAGLISSGTIKEGEEITVLPSGKKARIKSIITFDGPLKEAGTGESVTLTLDKEIDISRGNMLSIDNPIVDKKIEALICWMGESTNINIKYFLKHTTRCVRAFLNPVYKINMNNLNREKVDVFTLNDIGLVEIETSQVIFFDSFQENPANGRFIIIDPESNATVAAGVILGPLNKMDPQRIIDLHLNNIKESIAIILKHLN